MPVSDAVVFIGFGGHAKACLDVATSMGLSVPFVVGIPGSPSELDGIRVLQHEESMEQLKISGITQVFVAVGDNQVRNRLSDLWEGRGFQLATLISPLAIISPSSLVEPGSVVMPLAFVGPSVRIGRGVILNTASVVEHDACVGDFAHVAPSACLTGSVRLGQCAFVGAAAVITPGVLVCDQVTVGAGSVVIANIDHPGTYVGAPVRKVD